MKSKALVSWSGGKDGCLALHRVRAQFDVTTLLTMLIDDGSRTRSHGLRPQFIEAHAKSLGAEALFGKASWPEYENEFIRLLSASAAKGITHAIFGDVFPDAHRQWVEKVCAAAGVEAVLPLWADNTKHLAEEFIDAGGEAILVTVRAALLGQEWLGRKLDRQAMETGCRHTLDNCLKA